MLVLRCYGFCTVLDSLDGWFQSVLRRESSGPASRSSLRAMEGRSKKQERAQRSRASFFKLSNFGPAHRRLVESECPYGKEPRPCPWGIPSLHFHVTKNKLLPMY